MRLYEYEAFPNPRRVRIFLAEKGIDIDRIQVDVPSGAHKSPEYLKKNPYGLLPMLELDDGTTISETTSICRYIEAAFPDRPLMGSGAKEQAMVDMWQRRAEETAFQPALAYFHHATEGLGESGRYRNRDWGLRNRDVARQGFRMLDAALAERPFLAGAAFSIADITALAAVDFAEFLEFGILAENDNLRAWHARVSARPSAAA